MRLGQSAGRREPVRRRLGAPTDAGHGRPQARRMIPPADTPPLADRGGWRYDHGRVLAAPAPLLAPPAGFPIRPALKHGPRSLTCVRSQRATKPVRRKEADWRDPSSGCTADRPRSSEKGSSVSIPVGTRKMVNYA
ncbi:hypothetical protein H6P81_021323 [Aristolochia fimbriata]|uniref:Uncharacterized protein n=1 Tax=Aristolochia fimbriata TaxID=158543 RepID=A0AAV7DQ73_ARIFI|nr:hypothetical protein H6P81_021323 [Aristolochia fimbriata]